jgi:hypothetical protein
VHMNHRQVSLWQLYFFREAARGLEFTR